jgi:hypothetical protein
MAAGLDERGRRKVGQAQGVQGEGGVRGMRRGFNPYRSYGRLLPPRPSRVLSRRSTLVVQLIVLGVLVMLAIALLTSQ